jgi:hypothetical protein
MQKISKAIAVFVVLALILLCGCVSKPVELQPFSSADGRFSILMPGAPKYESTNVDTAAGTLVMHSYMVEDAGMAYGVIYSDYPDFMKDADPQAVLDGGRDGAVAKIKGTLISETPLTLGGYPGRDITVSAGTLGFRSRIYLVNTRIYSVIVTGPTDKLKLPRVDEVLDSFKLTDKVGSP